MGWLRLVVRLVALGISIPSLYVVYLLGRLVLVPWPATLRRWRNAYFRLWAGLLCRILGMRLTVMGTPPEPPYLFVCNHLGYVDILLLAERLSAVFVSKAEVKSWPLVGALCNSFDTLYVDRSSRRDLLRVSRELEAALAKGHGVALFPEGTSTAGETVAPFKPSLLEPAARQGLPVHYGSITYRTPPGSPPAHVAVCWWDDVPFGVHLLKLLRLPYFEARVHFASEPLVDTDRKRLAARLREAVQDGFEPVIDTLEERHAS